VKQPIRRAFPGRHDQVALARDFVRRAIGCCPALDEAILLTSELCTNALQHTSSGSGGLFEVTVYRRDRSLRVEVRDDGSGTVPVLRNFDELSEDGRGLEIVHLIAYRWGQNGDEYGRSVFFELRWNAPRAAGPSPASRPDHLLQDSNISVHAPHGRNSHG
jgi:serine/threonine-protein kinase RsbW